MKAILIGTVGAAIMAVGCTDNGIPAADGNGRGGGDSAMRSPATAESTECEWYDSREHRRANREYFELLRLLDRLYNRDRKLLKSDEEWPALLKIDGDAREAAAEEYKKDMDRVMACEESEVDYSPIIERREGTE